MPRLTHKELKTLSDAIRKLQKGRWSWEKVFVIFPRKCCYTNKWIMPFRLAYQGKRRAPFPIDKNEYVYNVKWVDKHSYLMLKLTNKFDQFEDSL